MIDVRVKAVPDNAALLHGQRGLFLNGTVQQIHQIPEILQIVEDAADGGTLDGFCRLLRQRGENLADRREHADGVAEGDQISGIGCLIGHFRQKPLQIINRRQILAELIAVHTEAAERLHRVQPLFDRAPVYQGLLKKAVQKAGAHGGLRVIQHPEKRPVFVFLAKRLRQFQIAAGRAVQQHVFAGQISRDARNIAQIIHLGVIEIAKQRAGSRNAALKIINAERNQRGNTEMFLQQTDAGRLVKIVHIQRRDSDAEALLQLVEADAAHQKGFVAENLGGCVANDLIIDFAAVSDLCQIKLAGGDVADSDAGHTRPVGDAENVIILSLLQGLHIDVGAGCDNSGHLPLHHPFGETRILHLLTDSDLIALFHQSGDIGVHGVIRDAAHGRALFQAARFSGQRQLQFF